jgi:hypothetical protein
VKILARLGGRTAYSVISAQLKYLLSTRLQKQLNWCGKKSKASFGKLTVAAVVISECALLNTFISQI